LRRSLRKISCLKLLKSVLEGWLDEVVRSGAIAGLSQLNLKRH